MVITYIFKFCSSSWFVLSICPFICRWKAVDNFISIPNILFNSFINPAANYSPLSEITLSNNPYNFHILFLNNFANLFTNIKYNIFENLYITKIEL